MSAPQHIGTILSAMFAPCPYCKARALTPCRNGQTELRYTHLERNRV